MAVAGQQPHEFILRTVGVLIFIDHEILKPPIVILANRCDRLQQAHGFEQQVVEVHGVGFAQLLAILLVDVGNALGLGIGRLQIDLLRIEHVILGPGNVESTVRGVRSLSSMPNRRMTPLTNCC